MELYQLRTFLTVAEFGSLSRASQRLHVSQPAASGHIKALEDEFGLALFERKPKGLSLTRAGAALLPHAQRLLTAAAELSGHAKRLSGQVGGQIKFGAFFDPSLLRLGELMSRLVRRHPMIEIEVHHNTSRAVVAGVLSGELDAGIALGENELPGLIVLPLTKLHYRIVAPGDWSQRVSSAGWKDIARLPWISAPRGGSHHQMAERIFRRHRFRPLKVMEADSESIITNLVIAGVGLGLMREDLALEAQAAGRVVVLRRNGATTLLRFLYPRSRESDPPIRALVELIQELWSPNRTS